MKIQQFTYLILDVLSVSVPLACSFEHKLQFWKKWKFYLPSLFITAIFFLVWDYFKTKHGVWSFNPEYVVGIYFLGMPLEEYLFFLTIPYACTFIYETLERFVVTAVLPTNSKRFLLVLSLVFILLSFFALDKIYTWSVLVGASIVLPLLMQVVQGMKLQSFILMYLVALFPMFIVNGFLTALPVVSYNNAENLNLRLGTIPIEDFIYNLILMAMNIGLYEFFRLRSFNLKLKGELPVVQFF